MSDKNPFLLSLINAFGITTYCYLLLLITTYYYSLLMASEIFNNIFNLPADALN